MYEKISKNDKRRYKQNVESIKLERDYATFQSLASEYQRECEELESSKAVQFFTRLFGASVEMKAPASSALPKSPKAKMAVNPAARRLQEDMLAFAVRFENDPVLRAPIRSSGVFYLAPEGSEGELSCVAAAENADASAVLFDLSEAGAKPFSSVEPRLRDIVAACEETGQYLIVVLPDECVGEPKVVASARSAAAVENMLEGKKAQAVARAQLGVLPHVHNPVGCMRGREWRGASGGRTVYFPDYKLKRATKAASDAAEMLLRGVYACYDARPVVQPAKDVVFPRKYDPYLVLPVGQDTLGCARKLFDFTVSVGAAVDGETVRAYEVQAEGGLVLANNVSGKYLLPGVFAVGSSGEIAELLSGCEDTELDVARLEGIREVMCSHTVYDRLNKLLADAGMSEAFSTQPVYVVCDDPTLVAESVLEPVPGMCVVTAAELRELSPAEGYAVRVSGGPVYRGRYFLVDMVNAMKFADAAYVRYADKVEDSYEYEDASPSAFDCLFDLAKVSSQAVLDGELPEVLRGFKVASAE